MPGEMARTTETDRRRRVLLLRSGRSRNAWVADEVAAHLMGCRVQIVRGLARKTPWAGLDDETLDSCFGHAAAVIAKVAVTGQRPDWRTPRDLEKAQIAAYRHQALDHWKRVNALSRQGDRSTVAFDPERHASCHDPMDRLFDQPDLRAIERDLLAELADDRLRSFWTIVLREGVPFKTAGDRLELSKAAVMACTRGGRAAFAGYLDRREDGDLCRDRSHDIAAKLAGTATRWRIERADAHLECCYACALIHEPSTSAMERGILGLGPAGLILRLVARASDAVSAPVVRVVESGGGSRAVAAGLAALTVAGAGVGAHRGSTVSPSDRRETTATSPVPTSSAEVVRRTAPAPQASTVSSAKPKAAVASKRRKANSERRKMPLKQRLVTQPATSPPPAVTQSNEFDIEAVPQIPAATPTVNQPPDLEFANP